jgi:hypothetical protein
MKHVFQMVMMGCIVAICGGLLAACINVSSMMTAKPGLQGCVLGYTVSGLCCLSLQTGRVRPLWPDMPKTDVLQVAAPAIDWETLTLYYIDANQRGIMKWQSGSASPDLICQLQLDEGQNIAMIEWLLLTPAKDALLFRLPSSWKSHAPPKFMAYHLHTGEFDVLAEDVWWRKRPVWVNQSQLLTENMEVFDIRQREITSVFNDSSEATLSPTHAFVLVFMQSPYMYHLYDFPDFRLRKTFSQAQFDRAGALYFVDEQYLLSELRSSWSREISSGTYLFNIHTEQWRKLSRVVLRGMYYSAICPDWTAL